VIISGTFTVSDDHVYAAYDGGVKNITALKELLKTAGAFSDTDGSTTNYNTIAATALSKYDEAKKALKTAQANNAAEEALAEAQAACDDALTAYRAAQKDSATYAALTYTDLYFYNYNFYTSLDALSKVMTLPDNLITKTEDNKTVYDMTAKPANGKSNIQILSEYGVTFYKQETAASGNDPAKYRTYYLYVLKHYNYASGTTDTDISVMSPMKYAVVRNNVYQMKIKGVAALGSSSWDPTDPDPLDGYYPGPNPDEEREIYLKMELDILKWVVRTQGENGGITLK
jgi:hypothetical protein